MPVASQKVKMLKIIWLINYYSIFFYFKSNPWSLRSTSTPLQFVRVSCGSNGIKFFHVGRKGSSCLCKITYRPLKSLPIRCLKWEGSYSNSNYLRYALVHFWRWFHQLTWRVEVSIPNLKAFWFTTSLKMMNVSSIELYYQLMLCSNWFRLWPLNW